MSLHEWKESLKESILKQNSSLKSFEKVEDLLMKAIKLQRKRKLREGIKTVIFSKEILKNSNYNKYEKVIKDIKNSFENGTFNNIFNRLSKHHKQNEFYNDSMLDILDIEHFHLDDIQDKRTSELLYVYYSKDNVYFIDIFNHKNFLDKEILEVMFNNWGSELNGFAYSEILGNSKDISNKSRFDLAKKRINYPYIIEDKSTKKQYNIIKNNIMANGDSSEDLTKCMLEERKVNLFIEELDYFTGKFVLLYF